MGCVLIHNQDKAVWNLASGTWVQDDKVGYTLKNTPNLRIADHVSPHFVKQLLNLPSLGAKMYPSEFLYDPETGKRLKKVQINSDSYWLAPYGQSLHYEDGRQYVDSHGLQLSTQLKELESKPDVSNDAPLKIKMPPRGIFEFVSIKVGTDIPQLIALNKRNGDLFIWTEHNNEWLNLKAQGQSLQCSPKQIEESFQLLGVVSGDETPHLYIPTKAGLARVIIDGLAQTYHAQYVTEHNPCLGAPVYWNKKILQPMLINNQVQIVDVLTRQTSVVANNPASEIYFEKVVYDNRRIIWVGKSGQLILKFEGLDDQELSVVYEMWIPGYEPDFRFGAPYDDRKGNFYQFCTNQNTEKGPWCYIELDAEKPHVEPSFFRFTTGFSKFYLGDKLDVKDIWKEKFGLEPTHRFTVPLIEDEKHQLILGFSFDTNTNIGIEQKLEDESKQDIMLFIDTHDGLIDFHRVQVEKPLQSRFFIHQNVLYFYNPSLNEILGWELAA